MLDYDVLTVCAPPRCGNRWLNAALESVGVRRSGTCNGTLHRPGSKPGVPGVTLSRRPLSWLDSFYETMLPMREELILTWGEELYRPMSDLCVEVCPSKKIGSGEGLGDFVAAVIGELPGHVERVFAAYRGQDHTLVVRLERCVEDLCVVLDALGIAHDVDRIKNVPRIGARK